MYPLHSFSTHVYSLWYTNSDRSMTFCLFLTPLVHFVDRGEIEYGGGHLLCVSSPLPWGMGDAYSVCGASICPWDMGEGGPLGSSRPLFNDFRAVLQRSEKRGEAGSDPMTWFHGH